MRSPSRATLFWFACFALALYLIWRLYDVQVLRGPILAHAALEQRARLVPIPAMRGAILDRNGEVLAQSVPAQSIWVDPLDARDLPNVVAQLAKIAGPFSPQTVSLLHAPGTQFVYIARKVSYATAQRVEALNLPGVTVSQEETGAREYPLADLASTVIGYVGVDGNGLDGIESSYDDALRGTAGSRLVQYDALGRRLPVAGAEQVRPERDGLSVELTLDSYLQSIAQEALAQQVARFHAADGTAIVMNPWTGEVLAMANIPDFDPNRWEHYPQRDTIDRAVLDAYEPGSTYKLVTAAAALRSGKVTLNSRFPARDAIKVGGWTIHNAEDGFMPNVASSETLEQIVEYSHNVGAAEVAMRIGPQTFYAMERDAGFGEPTGIGLAGENPGIVPAPAQWSGASLATMAFGQGVAVTPIALTRYYCAVANGGLLMQPLLVRAYVNGSGAVVRRFGPQVVRRVFSAQVAADLRAFLRAVVEHGTGDPTAQIPGYATAGKTGTSQIEQNGRYEPGAYAASFIGMIPYDHPRYVIYVKIDRPQGSYYGSVVAAPVFVRIAQAAMARDGTQPAP
jgi:stage V sporulation protein D (sporulation-specific penicillin-binding protein)